MYTVTLWYSFVVPSPPPPVGEGTVTTFGGETTRGGGGVQGTWSSGGSHSPTTFHVGTCSPDRHSVIPWATELLAPVCAPVPVSRRVCGLRRCGYRCPGYCGGAVPAPAWPAYAASGTACVPPDGNERARHPQNPEQLSNSEVTSFTFSLCARNHASIGASRNVLRL